MMDELLWKNIVAAGQDHLLELHDKLDAPDKADFVKDLQSVDWELLTRLLKQLHDEKKERQPVIEPPIVTKKEEIGRQAKDLGEQLLREGKVGIVLVAGGQGTRLGFDKPKGAFPISPIKNKSLLQLQAERIKALQRKYDCTLPWYIMTSQENDKATKEFFIQHGYFGIDQGNFMFFTQAMLPTVNDKGEVVLKSSTALCKNPDGHGGTLKALHESGALQDMEKRGITTIFYYQVDNALVKIADPVFLGHHALEQADMSTKVVKKTDPNEKVGLVATVNGKTSIVEYSNMPDSLNYLKNPDGSLAFNAGNIAVHAINVDYVKKINIDGFQLPYTAAKKEITCLNEQGEIVRIVGNKFETFIFDALPLANHTTTVEVKREEEFAPVKNKEGVDSPQTAKELQSNLHKSWMKKVGLYVPEHKIVEISPMFAHDEEEFSKHFEHITSDDTATYIGEKK